MLLSEAHRTTFDPRNSVEIRENHHVRTASIDWQAPSPIVNPGRGDWLFPSCNRRPRRNGSVRARECRGAFSGTRAQYESQHGRGGPPPAGLSPDEKHAWDQLDDFYKNGLGYALEMNNRPQTLYGIVDSPIGLAAWMIDHDARSQEMIARVFDGKTEGLTRDDVLDNVTLYWLTNTAISSARLYWDNAHHPTGGFFDPRGIKIPVAVSVFPDEIYAAPRSWAERAYPKLIHYNKLDKGTHFAAWEQPELFSAELRAAFRPLR
jgi:pimeloyl-ACP methyl ester carboxylesterase